MPPRNRYRSSPPGDLFFIRHRLRHKHCRNPGRVCWRLAGLVHVVGAIDQTYAVGRIVVDKPAGVEFGGLLGDDCDCVYIDVLRSYWNTQTMRVARSDGGAARNTTQLQASLPPGFNSSVSGITPGVTFPYLKLAGTDFQSPLAITVLGSEIFTFLPISQLEKSEYSPRSADRTSLQRRPPTQLLRARSASRGASQRCKMRGSTVSGMDRRQSGRGRRPVTLPLVH